MVVDGVILRVPPDMDEAQLTRMIRDLTAWEGNKPHWPKAKLGKDDKAARKLLEDAASWKFDTERFRKDIPNWLRHRFANQEGMHLT
mgnify:CR=1 FL=1